MKTTREYLIALRARHNVESWASLGRMLGVTPETIARYRKGGTFDDLVAFKVADLLNLPREEVYLSIQAERAANQENTAVHAVLCDALRRLGGIAACFGLLFFMPADSWALSQDHENNPVFQQEKSAHNLTIIRILRTGQQLSILILLPLAFAINFFTERAYRYSV